MTIRSTTASRSFIEPDFGAQLGIFLADQLDALDQFFVLLRIDRLAPAIFQRVAVPDAKPGGKNPTRDTQRSDEMTAAGARTSTGTMIFTPLAWSASAQRVDIARGQEDSARQSGSS